MSEERTEQNNMQPNLAESEADLPQGLSEEMDKILSKSYSDSAEIEFDTDENEKDTGTGPDAETESKSDASDADADESEELESAGDEDVYEEIDPRLVAAAKRLGWSDEKIVRVAEEDETILQDLADIMDMVLASSGLKGGEKASQESATEEEETDEVKGVETLQLSDEELQKLKDEYGEAPAKIIASLTEKLNNAIQELNDVKRNVHGVTKAERDREMITRLEIANRAFDDAAEVFPILGKTSELPVVGDKYDASHPAIKARNEIFNVAMAFEQMGYPFDKAMDEALNWYAGKEGTKEIQEKVVKELNARKKQFTARPTRKHTVRKYNSEDERIAATMDEIYQQIGIKEE